LGVRGELHKGWTTRYKLHVLNQEELAERVVTAAMKNCGINLAGGCTSEVGERCQSCVLAEQHLSQVVGWTENGAKLNTGEILKYS